MPQTVSLAEIIKASKNVYRYLSPTPLRYYQQLSKKIAASIWLKHENHNPTCAFKVRGGINLLAQLTQSQREAGLYTASTGNHGQSIAYASQVFQAKAVIYVPQNANPGKVAAMQSYGAQVVHFGDNFDQCRAAAQEAANKNKGLFIGPTDEILINGVGSYGLEIINDLPEVDVIIVPVGAGSGICATSIVAKTINPKIKIIGVQSAQAPAQQRSWKNNQQIEADVNTIAEGVATGVPFINTQKIMHEYVDEFIVVEDRDIIRANKILIETTHNLIEEASATTFAAALKLKSQLTDKKIVLVMTGGNISMQNLQSLMS
jgi:threonine dehydratase